ncbi:MAG: hypothetical protein QOF76_2525 [Solirubrobacteraceae bacterium]|jgi:hypothetical protein|nr:hypothetical protein [Solirubrobacteraceae bacterium]
MEQSRVKLPPGVRTPFSVYVNGVKQSEGSDYSVDGATLVFSRSLVKEGKLGFWKWFWGAFGIGHYGRNDEVDVSWSVDGAPRLAHALEIESTP